MEWINTPVASPGSCFPKKEFIPLRPKGVSWSQGAEVLVSRQVFSSDRKSILNV
jgi:hypothetical protein